MSKLTADSKPGGLGLPWGATKITASHGGMLRLCTGDDELLSNTASWAEEGPNKWSGRWPNIPGSITWEVSAKGEHIDWRVLFNAEKPMRCDRLEIVLPLLDQYQVWKISGVRSPAELVDPGILGERYNLDFLALKTSGFFTNAPTKDCRYLALASSIRPTLQAGSFSPKWPLVELEALSDTKLGAIACGNAETRELRLIAWPGRDGGSEIPPGTYKLEARIKVGKPPRKWAEEILRDHLDGVGAATGKVLQGPLEVQISPSNRCNQRCVACWCHAPFQRETDSYAEWSSKSMSLSFFEKLIEEVASGGTPVVSLIGQGDPLLHKDILKMVQMVKERGMRCRLNTNGLLLNSSLNRELIRIGLDRLHVSLWTSRKETYARLCPGRSGDELRQIEEALKDLTAAKEKAGSLLPHLEIFHAICNDNIDEIDELIEQAERVGANSIYIRPINVIPGRTEHLLPTYDGLEKIRRKLELLSKQLEGKSKLRLNFREYLEQISSKEASQGRYAAHPESSPCYLGWAYAIVHTDGAMSPCCMGAPLVPPIETPSDFLPIWTSEAFQEFRAKSMDMKKNADYFMQRFPCFTECCMGAVNAVVREKVYALRILSRSIPGFKRRLKRISRRAEKGFIKLTKQRSSSTGYPRRSETEGQAGPGYTPCENP